MKINILRKMEYEDTFIYVLQFEYIYLYQFAWKNEIYQQHVVAHPSFWKRLLWRLGRIATPYDKDFQDEMEKILLSGAMKSIDALKGINQDESAQTAQEVQSGLVAKPLPNEM